MFDGHASERRDEIDRQRTKRPLVKSHLLEVFGGAVTIRNMRSSRFSRVAVFTLSTLSPNYTGCAPPTRPVFC